VRTCCSTAPGGGAEGPRMKTRRDVLRLGFGAAMALTAACGPITPAAAPTAAPTPAPAKPAAGATTVSVSTPTPAAAAAAQPKRGGSLRVGMVGDAARLDGQLVTAVDATWMPFDRLTAYDRSLTPQPMLAESWEFSRDFKQLKLSLRKGV